MRTRVKICGITRVGDALAAEAAGADAVGVVACSDSPRSMPLDQVRKIFGALGPFTTTVVVTHTRSAAELQRILDLSPDAVQISHPFSRFPEYGGRIIRVIGKGDPIPADGDAIALDESRGSGRPFDPVFARRLVEASDLPVILCGGLAPENVAGAIGQVRPYAVDVCSGIETVPGIKDTARIRLLMDEVLKAGSADGWERSGKKGQ